MTESLTLKQTPVKVWSDFIRFPWRAQIYKDNPYWVPPLISEEKKLFNPILHPFYRNAQMQLFIAYQGGGGNKTPVGRIAAIINHNHNKFHNEKTGFFGFFESVNSPDVANYLLSAASDYLKEKGMEILRGPMSPSTNETCGLLIEGFDLSPAFMMPYNPPYYINLLESCGLKKAKDLYAYYLDTKIVSEKLPRLERIAQNTLSDNKVVIRRFDMRNIRRDISIIKEIYNNAWSKNWGFVPMTDEEFDYLSKEMVRIIDPDFVLIAEVEGKPAGFSMALPDYNQIFKKLNGRLFPFGIFYFLFGKSRIKTLRLLTMGVIPQYQKRGLDVVFYLETIKRGIAKGYQGGELSWVLEDNVMMNRVLNTLGARVYKKYRIYEKVMPPRPVRAGWRTI
ncbi:MAG: N-acetyltransferase [Planctomycetota bacterium]|nr:N-acetyltransferase [Planctomycetota bacterium]